jgi:hypothetical protein
MKNFKNRIPFTKFSLFSIRLQVSSRKEEREMNTKVKKGVFWGVIIAAMILVVNVLHYLLGGHSAYAEGRHGHGPGEMGQRGGGFEGHQFMNGPHHDGGFPWIGLLIGLALLFFLVRWLRKKAKTSSMNQFIDTPLVGSHTPIINQNASMLDQWEKNLTNKKGNV